MMQKRGGLGRNLSALLNQSTLVTSDTPLNEQMMMVFCSVDSIVPGRYQPRRSFDEAILAELVDSIQTQGLLQPLVVREIAPQQYELIAGERRWRACQLAGITKVPVVIKQVDDETALGLALIENLQREDLSAMDQARAMQQLTTEFGLTHKQIAAVLSKSRAAVSNYLRLLHLAPEVQEMLERKQLDMGHARALLPLTLAEQGKVAQMVLAKALSVRETEDLVARVKAGIAPRTKSTQSYPPMLQPKIDALATRLQAEVTLKSSPSGRGTLQIHYPDLVSLDAIMQILG